MLGTVLLLTTMARAEGKEDPVLVDAAADHHQKGVEFYRSGRFDAARIEFDTAFQLSNNPGVLFNLAKTCEQLGDYAQAMRHAERFQQTLKAPDPELDELLARLRARLAPPPPQPTPRKGLPLWPGVSGVVLGGVLMVSGIATAGLGYQLSRDVESMPLSLADYDAADAKGRLLNNSTIGLLVAGGVVAGAGITLVILSRRYSLQHKTP